MRRASAREASELTGFTIGGIPPIGHPRPVRVVMDPDLGRFAEVWAAAGTDGAVFPVLTDANSAQVLHRWIAVIVGLIVAGVLVAAWRTQPRTRPIERPSITSMSSAQADGQ